MFSSRDCAGSLFLLFFVFLLSDGVSCSAYVLLHHVMGEAAGQKGVWAYVEGGMGAIR